MSDRIDAKNAGTRGDGFSDDWPPLQAALDSGAKEITVPPGRYRISQTLRIGSHTKLILDSAARIVLADNAGIDQSCHLITNKHHDTGNVGIEIYGGIWDGNNPKNPRGPDTPDSYTGVALNFVNVRDLSIRDLTIVDPESFFLRLGEISEFLIENIEFQAGNVRPNQDGIHLGGHCHNGMIRNLRASGKGCTSDDMIAINADDAIHRVLNLGMKRGPISRIQIDGVYAEDCHSFVRMASVWSSISEISINNIVGGCYQHVVNADALRYCLTPIFDQKNPKYSHGVGLLDDIILSNVRIHRTRGNQPLLLLETRMRRFRITNFVRDLAKDINPAAPTFRLAHQGKCLADIQLTPEKPGLPPHFISGDRPEHYRACLASGEVLQSDIAGFESFSITGDVIPLSS
jgi:hypothetical protein